MDTFSTKDPDEIVPLAWDFGPLLAVGETIASATWTITDPAHLSADFANMLPEGCAIDGNIVKQRIANGTDGVSYRYRIQINTEIAGLPAATYIETPTQLVLKRN